MKNILKLIQNTDFSFEDQTRLYYHFQKCSIAIDKANKAYTRGKKLLTKADAALIKAIMKDDQVAKEATEREIVTIVHCLSEIRNAIKMHTANNMSFFNMVMNHQKPTQQYQDVGDIVGLPTFPEEAKEEAKQPSEPSEHVYVLPRQQVFDLLRALTTGARANPDFQSLEITLNTGYLKK